MKAVESRMKPLVIDASTALGFLLLDEHGDVALKAYEAIKANRRVEVPSHWTLEVVNGLLAAGRRMRISRADISVALDLIAALRVRSDDQTAQRAVSDTAALALEYQLTIYDAAYLELAMRRGAELATEDKALAKAAKAVGVSLFH